MMQFCNDTSTVYKVGSSALLMKRILGLGTIRDFFKNIGSANREKAVSTAKRKPSAGYDYGSYNSGTIWSSSYTGEKNTGALGPAIMYNPDYPMLRIRSWQSYIESEITKTVIDRYVTWVVGRGLKLQSSPNIKVLESEGFNDLTREQKDEFTRITEERFSTFSQSKYSSWNEGYNLHENEKKAFKNTLIGGDVLVVLRYTKKQVSIQLIDGQHVQSPPLSTQNSNRVVSGVEIDKRGRHVAYHVKTSRLGFERISATPKKSRPAMAFMVYGSEYRCDSVRGLPLIGTVLETLKKLDRYKEATVGSAEERAKIPFQVVHGINSTGENPMQKRLAYAMDADSNELPTDSDGREIARLVAVTTQKDVFNMPQDSKLEALESKVELNFGEFYDANFEAICSSVGIPPNVARMVYDDNFSASRAALKDWEHSLRVIRKRFSDQFNKPIYDFWLWTEVMSGKVQAVGLQNALLDENRMAIDAYMNARWIGAQVPHIDPLKEAKAEREKLGSLFADAPLETMAEALENLGAGDVFETIERTKEELAELEDAGLTKQPEPIQQIEPQNGQD